MNTGIKAKIFRSCSDKGIHKVGCYMIPAVFFILLSTVCAEVPEGDVDGNLTVDLKDAVLVLKVLSGNAVRGLTLEADVNGDNKIGAPEAAYVLRTLSDQCDFMLKAGFGRNVYEKTSVTLCGRLISQCTGDFDYNWTQAEGSSVNLTNADMLCGAEFKAPAAGGQESLVFRLTATDSSNNIITDDISINVRPVSESCEHLVFSDIAIEKLDLSDTRVKEIHDALKKADPVHAYQVLIRSPDDFMQWINMNTTLSGAVHETNHEIDSDLSVCSPFLKSKYLSVGNLYPIDLEFGDTAHYSIVEETIAPSLKNSSRYEMYIEGTKDYNGNDLRMLLDELNAYAGDAWFQMQFQNSGLPGETDYYKTSQFQLDGVVNFMVYLQYYLKSARLNYPDTYQFIQTNQTVLGFLQHLWTNAEELLNEAYPLIMSSVPTQYIFFTSDEATGLDHLKAAYSDDLLAELDKLDIVHFPASVWENTYFSYDARLLRWEKIVLNNDDIHHRNVCRMGGFPFHGQISKHPTFLFPPIIH